MAVIEVIMPKMGESIMEATVLNWLKQPGDYVEADDFILEVATDKIDTEVPSPVAGVLQKILVQVGEVATIGKAICIIDVAEGTNTLETSNSFSTELFPIQDDLSKFTDLTVNTNFEVDESANPWISPLIKQICLQENVSQRELSGIKGTGLDQRITKKDVLTYIAIRNSKHTISSGTLSQGPGLRLPGDEVIEMDRMRKMISERMVDSKRVAPHVTSFLEADMTNLVAWREKVKSTFLAKYNEPITYTPLLIMFNRICLTPVIGSNIGLGNPLSPFGL